MRSETFLPKGNLIFWVGPWAGPAYLMVFHIKGWSMKMIIILYGIEANNPTIYFSYIYIYIYKRASMPWMLFYKLNNILFMRGIVKHLHTPY